MAPDVIFYKTKIGRDGSLEADVSAPPRPGWLFGAHLLEYIKTKYNPTRGLSCSEIETEYENHLPKRSALEDREPFWQFESKEDLMRRWAFDRQRAADFVDWCREYWRDELMNDKNEPVTVFISEN